MIIRWCKNSKHTEQYVLHVLVTGTGQPTSLLEIFTLVERTDQMFIILTCSTFFLLLEAGYQYYLSRLGTYRVFVLTDIIEASLAHDTQYWASSAYPVQIWTQRSLDMPTRFKTADCNLNPEPTRDRLSFIACHSCRLRGQSRRLPFWEGSVRLFGVDGLNKRRHQKNLRRSQNHTVIFWE